MCYLQLRVTAVDDQDPGRVTTADVSILVQRNANSPKFGRDQYRVTVTEKHTLGEPVIQVNATDKDGVSGDCSWFREVNLPQNIRNLCFLVEISTPEVCLNPRR